MAEKGGYGGFGQPGDRQTGKRDAASEVWLILLQGGVYFFLGVVTFAFALVCAFALGGVLATAALSVIVWALKALVVDWLDEHVHSDSLFWIVEHTEIIWPAAVAIAGALITMYILPYGWDYNFDTRQSFIVLLQQDGESVQQRFALLARLALAVVPCIWFVCVPVIIRRFKYEVMMAVTAQAVQYAEVGVDIGEWGPKPREPQAAPVDTVTLEITEKTPTGNKIVAYPDIHHRPEVRRAFIALNAGTIPNLSKGYISGLGISQGISGDIMSELFEFGFVDYPRDENENPDKHQSAYLTARGKGLAAMVAGGAF